MTAWHDKHDDQRLVIGRQLPWLVALIGLTIPLLGNGFAGWPIVAVWLVALAVIYAGTRSLVATPQQKVVAALLLLPLLVAAGWVVGWWLIPADVTWLVLSVRQWFAERTAVVSP